MAVVVTLVVFGIALVAGAVGFGAYLNAKRAQSTNRRHAVWRRQHASVQARRPPNESI